MCDYIIMPNSEEEVYSIVEDGTCLCQNTQEEILRWIVQHLPNVEFDEEIEIVRNCCGWEVYIKKMSDDVCDETVECEYNYHDNVHPDVCHFECMLDANLEFNDRLTPKAQEYRDKLIVGVERMMKKVEDYKNLQ